MHYITLDGVCQGTCPPFQQTSLVFAFIKLDGINPAIMLEPTVTFLEFLDKIDKYKMRQTKSNYLKAMLTAPSASSIQVIIVNEKYVNAGEC